MIRGAVLQHIQNTREKSNAAYLLRREGRPVRLHVSELGHCVRKAYLRMSGARVTHPFDSYVQEIMHAGLVWEAETRAALLAAYGDKMRSEVPVENSMWSGRIDFLLPGIVVEHKATSPVNFLRKDRLPYKFHCMQALGYAELLPQTFVEPEVRLYYRSWANWGELEVWEDTEGAILWEGKINGKFKYGSFPDSSVAGEMAFFEAFWEPFWHDRSLPPRYDTPFTEQFGCCRVTKKGAYPSCAYFGLCWPQMAHLKSPFDPEKWTNVREDACQSPTQKS